MNKTLRISIAAAAFAAFSGVANADGLLGRNYIDSGFSLTKFGDDSSPKIHDWEFPVDGEAYSVSLGGNVNLQPNLDLRFAMSYTWADENSDGNYVFDNVVVSLDYKYQAIAGMAQLVYFFEADETITPYVCAGALLQYAEEKINDMREDDIDFGVTLGAGCEIVPADEVLLRVGFDYIRLGDDNEFNAVCSFGYWLQDNILGSLSLGYDFESENKMVKIGGVIAF